MSAQNSDLREEAAAVVSQYIEHGRGAESSVKIYSATGDKYDQYMDALNYGGPSKAVEIIAELLKENYDAKILDIGAGTGLVGEKLVKLGYKNLDAVDASEGMLEVARKRKIYNKIVCQFVGSEKMPFDNGAYDLAFTCGALGENALPLEAFHDIIRVVKPGGYIVNVLRAEGEKAPWYKDSFDALMSKLEKEGVWKLHLRNIFPNFMPGKDGLALIYLVL